MRDGEKDDTFIGTDGSFNDKGSKVRLGIKGEIKDAKNDKRV